MSEFVSIWCGAMLVRPATKGVDVCLFVAFQVKLLDFDTARRIFPKAKASAQPVDSCTVRLSLPLANAFNSPCREAPLPVLACANAK